MTLTSNNHAGEYILQIPQGLLSYNSDEETTQDQGEVKFQHHEFLKQLTFQQH